MNLSDARGRLTKIADSLSEATKFLGRATSELVILDGAIANIQGVGGNAKLLGPANGRRARIKKTKIGAKPEEQGGMEDKNRKAKPSLPEGHFPPTPVKRGRPAKAKPESEETGNEETAEA